MGITEVYTGIKRILKSTNKRKHVFVDVEDFRTISRDMFSHIIDNLLTTGENMWMPYGELVIRRKEQNRTFHRQFHGKDKTVVMKPILEDWYNVILWQYKPTTVGVRVRLAREKKALMKQVLEEKGETFYKLQGKDLI